MHPTHISSILISDDVIRQKITSIFVDSIIVDQKFHVVSMSQNVLDFLEFTNEQVAGKHLNYFAGETDLVSMLSQSIAPGHFEDIRAFLYTKSNRKLQVSISGFYLGLISDINGYIVLKAKNLELVELVTEQLQKKTAELDKFIYSAAHDLRGPVATMKGLINLMRIRENDSEIDRFILLLDAQANRLDERLFQLIYLAKADEEQQIAPGAIDFSCIETSLRKNIELNAFVDFLEFHYTSPEEEINGIDEVLLSSLLNNILLYLLSLRMNTTRVRVDYDIVREEQKLKIIVTVNGFEVGNDVRDVIQNGEFAYTDMIRFPQLLSFYAAQKIAWQLDARMNVLFSEEAHQMISIVIPLRDFY